MVKQLHLRSAFLVSQLLKALSMQHVAHAVCCIVRQWHGNWEQFGVECLTQEHFNIQAGGVWD